PTIMDNVSCPACPTTGGSGIEDGKPVRRERRGNELNGFHTPFPSILHLLLPTIFVSVFICFSGAAKAQSRQDVGTAGAVIQGEVRSAVDGQPLEGVVIRLRNQTRITDAQGEFSIRTDLAKGHIEARHVGYESVTVPFDFRSNIINI